MRDFFQPSLDVPPELAFKYLSPPHWVYLIGWAAIIIALCAVMPRRSEHAKLNVFKFFLFTYLMSEASRIIWGVYHGLFMWQDWLPLHLCAMFVYMGPLMVYTKNARLKHLLTAFTYGVTMPAAFFAVLTPDKIVINPFHFEFFQTMYSHGALVCMGVYTAAVLGYRPRVRDIPPLFGMILCALVVCFAANSLINYLDPQEIPLAANYMFLTFPPKDTPLEAFASFAGRFYIIPTLGLLLFVWLLLYLPWEFAARKREKMAR